MPKTALMFGSIGAVAETSEMQRCAYNQALGEAGLNWEWNRQTYSELLDQAGGKERLAMLAAATGTVLSEADIEKIHARKTELACAEVSENAELRQGVAKLLAEAKMRGMKTALVTTTYQPNIDAIMAAGELSTTDFDCIISRADVASGKPAPDAYEAALKALGITGDAAIAVEDTATSVMAAKRAGLSVIATPGELTSGQDFWQADLVLNALANKTGTIDPRVLTMLG